MTLPSFEKEGGTDKPTKILVDLSVLEGKEKTKI